MKKAYELACEAKPTARQIEWQQTEFYALISYGMPVFTGKQYGDGFTPPTVFWPEEMNTDLWCETAVKAGMKGIVFTCKHYDGFCLWPTQFTDYSIKNSNWLDGDGDLVKMVFHVFFPRLCFWFHSLYRIFLLFIILSCSRVNIEKCMIIAYH